MEKRSLLFEDDTTWYHHPFWKMVEGDDGSVSVVVNQNIQSNIKRLALKTTVLGIFYLVFVLYIYSEMVNYISPIFPNTFPVNPQAQVNSTFSFHVFVSAFISLSGWIVLAVNWIGIRIQLSKGPVLLLCNQDAEITIPRKNVVFPAGSVGSIELVHDYSPEYFLYSPETFLELDTEDEQCLRQTFVELNLIIQEGTQNTRYPVTGEIGALETISLAKKLAAKTGWLITIQIGEELRPEEEISELHDFAKSLDNSATKLSQVQRYEDATDLQLKADNWKTLKKKHVKGIKLHKKADRALLFIMLPIFILTGLGMSFFCLMQILEATSTHSWPAVAGKIVSAKLDISDSVEGRTFTVPVEYQYSVNNHQFSGDRIQVIPPHFYNEKEANIFLQKYPAGKEIQVFYNPNSPRKAVLVAGAEQAAIPNLLFFFFFTTFSCVCLWLFLRSQRKRKRHDNNRFPS